MNPLFEMSVAELAAQVRSRALSPVEIVEAHIARVEEVTASTNALAVPCFERAMDEARAAEAAVMSGAALGPLTGVPCTIKEFLALEGMPHTGGLLARRDIIAEADAVLVARLRRAGAIVMGSSNVPEGGMWMETHNKIYGRTRNPWRLTRTSGGSSGGEGALVGAGASPFGIGSDIAGSIRIPAAFCGAVGHKPTGRLVPNTGHWGPDEGDTGAFLTAGPLTRRVADAELVLDIIAGPDDGDRYSRAWELPRWSRGDLSKVTVYPIESVGRLPTSEVMRDAVRRSTDALVAQGARRGELEAPLLERAFAIWAVAMSEANADAPGFAHLLGDGEPIGLGAEVARSLVGRSRVTFPALALALLERAAELLPKSLASKAPPAAALQAELEAALGPAGVMLVPPYTRPAPRHRLALLTPFHFLGTGIFNLIEFPVTQVPVAESPKGLPVGVQVAGARGNDRLTLMVAGVLEEAFGGYRPAEPSGPDWRGWTRS